MTSSLLAFSKRIEGKYRIYSKPNRLLPSLIFLRFNGAHKIEKINIINAINYYFRHYLNFSLNISATLRQPSVCYESWYRKIMVFAKHIPQQDLYISAELLKPAKTNIIQHFINNVQNHERLTSEAVYPQLKSRIVLPVTTLPERGNKIAILQVITSLQEHKGSDSNRMILPQLNEKHSLELSHVKTREIPLTDTGKVLKTIDNSIFRENKRPAGKNLKIVKSDMIKDRILKIQILKAQVLKREMPFEKIFSNRDINLQHAKAGHDNPSSALKNSVSNVNKTSDLVLKKPVVYSENKTSEHVKKNVFMHTDETVPSRNIHVKSSFSDLSIVADEVYKLIESKISIEKERRGLR